MVRCKATSKRSQKQCLKWAVKGRTTCHMHGGTAYGPVTLEGKEKARLAAYRHGGHTKQVKESHREAMTLIRRSKEVLRSIV